MEWADNFTDDELFFMVNCLLSFYNQDKENLIYW
jgi:hypothetical protein